MSNSFDAQLHLLYGDQYEPRSDVKTVFMASTNEQELVQWLKALAEKWFTGDPHSIMPLTVALMNSGGLGHVMAANGASPDEVIEYAQELIQLSHNTSDPMVLAAAVGEAHMMEITDERELADVLSGLRLGTINLMSQGTPAVTVSVTTNQGGQPRERMFARYVNDQERTFEGDWFMQESDPGKAENVLAFTGLAPS